MKNTLLVGLCFTLNILVVSASDSISNLTINPDKVLSKEIIEAVTDVQLIHNVKEDLALIYNASPINEIRVYNEKGTLVSKRKHVSTKFKYDLSNLEKGTYCFRIQVDKEVVTKIVEKN